MDRTRLKWRPDPPARLVSGKAFKDELPRDGAPKTTMRRTTTALIRPSHQMLLALNPLPAHQLHCQIICICQIVADRHGRASGRPTGDQFPGDQFIGTSL
jgi:hypothetical protein